MAAGNGYATVKDEIVRLRQEQRQILDVLNMLFDLLEAYGPSWYTEEHHDRALSALSVSASHAFRQGPAAKGN